MTDAAGIVSIPSAHDVDATLEKLKALLEAKGVKLFATIDHSGEAANAGLKMSNTKLLIFGSPAAGTPLMVASPTAALDLPLKILIWEEAPGKTWVTYNSVEYLAERHHLPSELISKIAVIDSLAHAIAGQAPAATR